MRACGLAVLILMLSSSAFAHVGSPNVYLEGDAGPYHLLLSVNPPAMVPGIAQVQVRGASGTVKSIRITPVYINGKDQGLPPTPDLMQSGGDPQWFTGKVWLMESGSWEIRVEVSGPQGIGRLAVPVPAFARRTLPMQKALGTLLFGLMLLLSVGLSPSREQRHGKVVSEPRPFLRHRTDVLDESQWRLRVRWVSLCLRWETGGGTPRPLT